MSKKELIIDALESAIDWSSYAPDWVNLKRDIDNVYKAIELLRHEPKVVAEFDGIKEYEASEHTKKWLSTPSGFYCETEEDIFNEGKRYKVIIQEVEDGK